MTRIKRINADFEICFRPHFSRLSGVRRDAVR